MLNRTRTVSEILYLYMHAAIRVTSQLANPPVSKSTHSLFPIHESAGREIRHRTIIRTLPCDIGHAPPVRFLDRAIDTPCTWTVGDGWPSGLVRAEGGRLQADLIDGEGEGL